MGLHFIIASKVYSQGILCPINLHDLINALEQKLSKMNNYLLNFHIFKIKSTETSYILHTHRFCRKIVIYLGEVINNSDK